jgi:hypothetical protein
MDAHALEMRLKFCPPPLLIEPPLASLVNKYLNLIVSNPGQALGAGRKALTAYSNKGKF